MNKNLTDRQQLVLDELIAFQREKGFSPTTSELAGRLGFRSPNAASDHLRILHKKGAIRLTPGVSRGIAIIGDSDEDTAVSLLRSLVDGDEYAREHAIAFLESREVEA
ncbi:LexA family transcriptional regulator [Klebsiella sp. RIT-PI-d]|nr:LexA family transcriptional regulator [Klebsiella sp. RIT-PI-d]KNC10369.1 LexA family transcriptional regulator [Klebsiella sp. RIT-PI-d]